MPRLRNILGRVLRCWKGTLDSRPVGMMGWRRLLVTLIYSDSQHYQTRVLLLFLSEVEELSLHIFNNAETYNFL